MGPAFCLLLPLLVTASVKHSTVHFQYQEYSRLSLSAFFDLTGFGALSSQYNIHIILL